MKKVLVAVLVSGLSVADVSADGRLTELTLARDAFGAPSDDPARTARESAGFFICSDAAPADDLAAAATVARRTGRDLCVRLAKPQEEVSGEALRARAFCAMAHGALGLDWGTDAVPEGLEAEIRSFASLYDRLRCTDTHRVTTNALDTGFFKGVRREDGLSLVVGECVGRSRGDPWRALTFFAPRADGEAAVRTVRVRSAYPVHLRTASDARAVAPEADGFIRFSLPSDGFAILATELHGSDIAPDMDRTKLLCVGSYAIPWNRVRKASERDVTNVADLGLYATSANVRPDEREKLAWLRKHGIRIKVREEQRWWGGSGDRSGKMRETWPMSIYERDIANLKTKYAESMIYAYDYCDEPSVLDMPYAGEVAAKFINSGVRFLPFMNIYPNYASVSWTNSKQQYSQLGTATYVEYVDCYCRETPLDYICFDHYPINDRADLNTGINAKRYYDNWEDVARAARRTGRDIYFVGQVNTKPKDERWLTENQIRFQVSGALAYGTVWYSFATLNEGWWKNWVFTHAGERTEHFEKVRRIVKEMKRMGADYMRFRNVDTVLVGFPERGGIPSFSNGFFRDLAAADGSRLVVGDMVAQDVFDSRRAVYVFAADDINDVKRQTREIRFCAAGPASVRGPDGPLTLRRNGDVCSFDLRDSAGALVILDL